MSTAEVTMEDLCREIGDSTIYSSLEELCEYTVGDFQRSLQNGEYPVAAADLVAVAEECASRFAAESFDALKEELFLAWEPGTETEKFLVEFGEELRCQAVEEVIEAVLADQ